MIDFRYHIVSLVAVFLALAIGIVLGSGPLNEPIQGTLKAQANSLKKDSDQLRVQIATQNKQLASDEKFTTEVTKSMIPNQLAARTVVVVALPGVGKDQVAPVTKILSDAGAKVTGSVRIADKYTDPKNASALEDLALRLVPPGVTFPDNATPMQRVATVLAAALVVNDPSKAGKVDNNASEVLAGMSDFGALTTTGEPAARAELAVVLTPAAPTTETAATDAAVTTELPVAETLDARSRGTLVAGPRGSSTKGGVVAAVRGAGNATKGVSTIDDVDTSAGLLATVLALVEQTRGFAGNYGTGDNVDGVIPDLSSSTR